MAREFGTVGVVGLGTMGAGIAEVFARNGHTVVGYEPADDALERGRGHIQRSTDRAVSRGKLSADEQAAVIGRVTFTTALEDLADCSIVVEAVPEILELKRAVFADLDGVCGPDAILATNTSSLSVTDIATATSRPNRVIGMHFFNPAPVMRLIEVVRTVVTDEDIVTDVQALARSLGKVDVTIADRAGFVANALLFGYLNRAALMWQEHRASKEDIDAAMTEGIGLPMGPFALLDLIGNDTGVEILATMYEQSGDRRHIPAAILTQMVTAGLLGRKSGIGFYVYGDQATDDAAPTAAEERPALAGGIGVVGDSPEARRLADACEEAGLAVTYADASAPSTVADCAIVLLAAALDRDAIAGLVDALPFGTVVASTARTGRVIDVAMATGHPERVIGLQLAGRPASRGVVEVVRTVESAEAAVDAGLELARVLERRGIIVADRAGRLVDALLVPHLNYAARMLAVTYASAADIDAAMTLGCGYPVGPLAMLDEIGLDTALALQREIHEESGEHGLAPSPLLVELVAAGHLGGASGRGIVAAGAAPTTPST